jgi:hypothetical protein
MATNVGTGHRGHALAHITLISSDLSRLRAIRSRRSVVQMALASSWVVAGLAVVASVAYLGAPVWLALIFGAGVACTMVIQATSSPERVGPDFYGET